jgi:hypothetical protein
VSVEIAITFLFFRVQENFVTSLSESSQGEVGDNREKWGDFWEKSIAIN